MHSSAKAPRQVEMAISSSPIPAWALLRNSGASDMRRAWSPQAVLDCGVTVCAVASKIKYAAHLKRL